MRSALVLCMVVGAVAVLHFVQGSPTGKGLSGYSTPYHSFVPPLPSGLSNFIPRNVPEDSQDILSADNPPPINSYVPPPSGTDSLPPTTHTIKPLPPLLPSSVLKQLMKTLAATSPMTNLLPPIPDFDSTKDLYNSLAGNTTLYTAGLLSSILQEGNSDFPQETTLREIESSDADEKVLNKTNFIIIRSEKQTYHASPKILETISSGAQTIADIYKDKSGNPYTHNQFLFIFKPNNVNFLNKLE